MVGVGLGDLLEGLDGLVNLTLLGLNHALHEAPLHRLGRVLAFFLHQLAGLRELPGLQGFFDGFFGGCRCLCPCGRCHPDQTHGQCQRGQAAGMPQKGQTP